MLFNRYPLTWVDLSVAAYAVGIHYILKAWGKLVGAHEGWWSVIAWDTIDKWGNCGSILPLKEQNNRVKGIVHPKMKICASKTFGREEIVE